MAVNSESFDTPIACPFHHFTGYCILRYRLASEKKIQPEALPRLGNRAARARIDGTLVVALQCLLTKASTSLAILIVDASDFCSPKVSAHKRPATTIEEMTMIRVDRFT